MVRRLRGEYLMRGAFRVLCSSPVQKTVELLLKRYFKNDKTKINAKALAAAAEVLRLMVIGACTAIVIGVFPVAPPTAAALSWYLIAEMIERAGEGARGTGDSEIDVAHLEKILPQLLLDF